MLNDKIMKKWCTLERVSKKMKVNERLDVSTNSKRTHHHRHNWKMTQPAQWYYSLNISVASIFLCSKVPALKTNPAIFLARAKDSQWHNE